MRLLFLLLLILESIILLFSALIIMIFLKRIIFFQLQPLEFIVVAEIEFAIVVITCFTTSSSTRNNHFPIILQEPAIVIHLFHLQPTCIITTFQSFFQAIYNLVSVCSGYLTVQHLIDQYEGSFYDIIIYLSAAMTEKNKEQPPMKTENILRTQSKRQLEIKMTPLLKFTEQIIRQLQTSQIEIDSLSLKDLKKFATGLALYKGEMINTRDFIKSQIIEKEKAQETSNQPQPKQHKTAEQRLGSYFFTWLGSLVGGSTQPVKSSLCKAKQENGYSQLPSADQQSEDLRPIEDEPICEETFILKFYLKMEKKKTNK